MASPPREDLEARPLLPVSPRGMNWRTTLRAVQAALWPWICGLSLAGMAVAAFLVRAPALIALAFYVVVTLLVTALLEHTYVRYSVVVLPVVVAFAVVGPSCLLEWLRCRRKADTPQATRRDAQGASGGTHGA